MSDPSPPWQFVENNALIFTELIKKIGVQDLALEELFSFDPIELEHHKKVHGIVLLHKFKPRPASKVDFKPRVSSDSVFFTAQTAANSSGTVALINVLSNLYGAELGESLNNFLSFTKDFDPKTRGDQLSIYEPIREAHNSLAFPYNHIKQYQPEDESSPGAYHALAFVYHHGTIWELDGLKEAPVLMGEAVEEDYLYGLINAVSNSVEELSGGEESNPSMFSVLALVDDPLSQLQKHQKGDDGNFTSLIESEIVQQMKEAERNPKLVARRTHNYIPFIVELLKLLAEKNALAVAMKNDN